MSDLYRVETCTFPTYEAAASFAKLRAIPKQAIEAYIPGIGFTSKFSRESTVREETVLDEAARITSGDRQNAFEGKNKMWDGLENVIALYLLGILAIGVIVGGAIVLFLQWVF